MDEKLLSPPRTPTPRLRVYSDGNDRSGGMLLMGHHVCDHVLLYIRFAR